MQKAHFTYRNVGADNLLALAVHDVDALGSDEVLVPLLLLLELAALVVLVLLHVEFGLAALGVVLEVEFTVVLVSGLLPLPGNVLGDGLGEGVDANNVVAIRLLVGAAEGTGRLNVREGAKAVDDGGRLVGIITRNLLAGDALDELHAVLRKEVELILFLFGLVLLELTGGADELAGGMARHLVGGGEVDGFLGSRGGPSGSKNEGGGNLHGYLLLF